MTTNTQTAMVLGSQEDITAYASRIGYMVRGGNKLNENERMALAQVALVTGLNPFIGEVWYIPGSGPMIGIAGGRKLDNQQAAEKGGYTWETCTSVDPAEAGASAQEIPNVAAAFRIDINDSNATAQYQALFTKTIQALREAGSKDPFAEAKEICGPRPMWSGYGFSTRSESSRMGKVQLARKRAHSDALKKRIIVPFGGTVAETDVAPAYDVDAEGVDMEYPELEQEKEPPNVEEAVGILMGEAPKETTDALSVSAIKWASEQWNISSAETRASIQKAIDGGKIKQTLPKAEFKKFVTGV